MGVWITKGCMSGHDEYTRYDTYTEEEAEDDLCYLTLLLREPIGYLPDEQDLGDHTYVLLLPEQLTKGFEDG